ncbi:hypothetical protein ACPOL_3495 [Acidisarcina polymorpha]|uniref:Oligosaccharide repeat unit polymerase n=1 Tax=Acidisarcina polymorpha TaxID=2211140 RepID=A0A2Z5G182_9BACT|nr:hypothetical protein [Acidisarcina polymorpha]AXC12780.1 hypothetical protein ACPOL_3495 [Acidisarcina polymorpha]
MATLKSSIVRNGLSPYALAIPPFLLFLFAWVFPPSLYTHYIREPDLMYLNPGALVYFILCLIAFLAGVKAVSILGFQGPRGSLEKIKLRTSSPLSYLAKPLFVTGSACFFYMLLIGAKFNFISLLLSQQGNVMKQAHISAANGPDANGRWGASLFLLTGVLWWAWYRASQLNLRKASKRAFNVLFIICCLIDLFTCLATVDRTNLMPYIAGLSITALFLKTRASDARPGKLIVTTLISAGAVIGSFLALQFARGASHFDAFVTSMLGYTIVSFNRLAAFVDGSLHSAYEGRGAYVFAFLLQNGRFAGLRHTLQLPTSFGLWTSEFPALEEAGLNHSFNWAGVFGYLYSDLGWWTPVYTFAIGMLAGYAWYCFKSGKTIGIVLYPWVCFWILFWFGWNLLFDARGIALFQAAVLLYIYDKIYIRTLREPVAVRPILHSSWEVYGQTIAVVPAAAVIVPIPAPLAAGD